MRRLSFEWPAETVMAVDSWRKTLPGEIISRNDAVLQLVEAGLLAQAAALKTAGCAA